MSWSRLLGEAIVRQGVGPDLGLAQVFDAQNGNRSQPELLCGFNTAVAGNDLPVGVRQSASGGLSSGAL